MIYSCRKTVTMEQTWRECRLLFILVSRSWEVLASPSFLSTIQGMFHAKVFHTSTIGYKEMYRSLAKILNNAL